MEFQTFLGAEGVCTQNVLKVIFSFEGEDDIFLWWIFMVHQKEAITFKKYIHSYLRV